MALATLGAIACECTPMRSTTVFNFYYPDYAYPGDLALNGVTTPEFQLTSDTNIMLLTNFIEQGIQTNSKLDTLLTTSSLTQAGPGWVGSA